MNIIYSFDLKSSVCFVSQSSPWEFCRMGVWSLPEAAMVRKQKAVFVHFCPLLSSLNLAASNSKTHDDFDPDRLGTDSFLFEWKWIVAVFLFQNNCHFYLSIDAGDNNAALNSAECWDPVTRRWCVRNVAPFLVLFCSYCSYPVPSLSWQSTFDLHDQERARNQTVTVSFLF